MSAEKNQNNSNSSSDEDELKLNKFGIYNMPKKAKYRQHAHMNPFSELSMEHPFNPSCIDWSKMYPILLKNDNKNIDIAKENTKLFLNSKKYPLTFENDNYLPRNTSDLSEKFKKLPFKVTIADFGCGYGGLLENMTKDIKDGNLALGLEIREKVTDFVGERIRALRLNSKTDEFNNISVLRANTMKMNLHLFYKKQLDKMFFCFADPHFKKTNHRKRIINMCLLNEYAYMLENGGKLYIITDVKDLFDWERNVLLQNSCFKELDSSEVEKDLFTEFMKNTNEARKVIKKNGEMYYSIFKRVDPKIQNLEELYNNLRYS